MPHAQRASRAAMRRWDIDPDDVFQTIMEESWRKIDTAIDADNPVGWLRRNMGYAIGRAVQERFWRKGNDVTDNSDEDYPDKGHISIEAKLDLKRAFDVMPDAAKKSFNCLHVMGYTKAQAADLIGLSASGVAHHYSAALEYMGAAAKGSKAQERKKLGFVYHFVHDDGREVRATFNDARRICGLSAGSLSQIKTGKREKVNGWRMV